ncbi:MAG: LamG domain-containing protein [Thermodesulfobacteriota bacterium]
MGLNSPPAILESSVSSVHLDGVNDWIGVDALDGEFVTGDDFTLEMWFNTDELAGSTFTNLLFSANQVSTERLMIGVVPSNGAIVVFTSTTATVGSGYNDGEWHHLVYTEDGNSGEKKVYVDGVLEGTITNLARTNWNLVDRYSIGQEHDTVPSDFFYGLLDEVSVYRTVLNEQQIITHYNLGAFGSN